MFFLRLVKDLLCFFFLLHCSFVSGSDNDAEGHDHGHGNNWAVLVAGSRYWFNYRHIANVLSIYHSIKKLGIPDSQIILMLPDDMACNDRNVFKGQMIASHATTKYDRHHSNELTGNIIEIYDSDIEVDYRGEECSVENVLRLLTNRHSIDTPLSKRLNTNKDSNILFYITGHGGDEFLKFHDKEEIQSNDISDAISIMRRQSRYNEILFVIDTCQASTLYKTITSDNVISIGSSKLGESSYSYRTDKDLGISIIDRFTYLMLKFFEDHGIKNQKLLQLFNSFDPKLMKSHTEYDHSLLKTRNFNDVKITDFFASVNDVDIVKYGINIDANTNRNDNNNNTHTKHNDNLWNKYNSKSKQKESRNIFEKNSMFLSLIDSTISQWLTAFCTSIVVLASLEKFVIH